MARCCSGPSIYEAVQLSEAAAAEAEAARDDTVVEVAAQSDWSGAVVLTADEVDSAAYMRRRLVGNVTAVTLPAGTTGVHYHVVWELTQDGTGSRTFAWPATIKFPSGTDPTISSGANSISIVRLWWSGSQWFGLTLGTAFA